MRSSWKTLVAVMATALVVPQFAVAGEVDDQLQQMQDRLSNLENKLQATNDELEASKDRVDQQQELIDRAGLDDRSGTSALSRFLEETEFDGWVAASWNWNFNGPPSDDTVAIGQFTGGVNRGGLVSAAPFHPDHNTFSLDQLWFSMRKEATEESRGGFGFQATYGKTGDILNLDGGLLGAGTGAFGASIYNLGNGNSIYIYEGYAEYLAPIANGVNIQVGRFGTNIGYETIRQVDQPYITRGIVWGVQPIAHTGLKLSTEIAENVTLMVGAVNNATDYNFETDNEKTFIGTLAYAGDNFGLSLNGLYGGDRNPSAFDGFGRTSDSLGILDFVGTFDPSDNLHLWTNFTWVTEKGASGPFAGLALVPTGAPNNQSIETYAIAGGGRLAVTDNTGFSLRGEYVKILNANGGVGLPGTNGIPDDDASQFAITGTIDHALTEQLTLTVEGRYDKAFNDGGADNFFTCGDRCALGGLPVTGPGTYGNYSKADQVLALIQLLYRF